MTPLFLLLLPMHLLLLEGLALLVQLLLLLLESLAHLLRPLLQLQSKNSAKCKKTSTRRSVVTHLRLGILQLLHLLWVLEKLEDG